ncbi:MAG: hypothetical protein ACPHHT_10880, partial [Ilumatobacteraceae bacterium]
LMHTAVKYIEEAAEELEAERGPSNELGRLTDQAAKILIDSGGFRLLQAKSHGGYEADITDFLAWVRTVARANPSSLAMIRPHLRRLHTHQWAEQFP